MLEPPLAVAVTRQPVIRDGRFHGADCESTLEDRWLMVCGMRSGSPFAPLCLEAELVVLTSRGHRIHWHG